MSIFGNFNLGDFLGNVGKGVDLYERIRGKGGRARPARPVQPAATLMPGGAPPIAAPIIPTPITNTGAPAAVGRGLSPPAGFPWPGTPFDVFGDSTQEGQAAALIAQPGRGRNPGVSVPWGSDLHQAMAMRGTRFYKRTRYVARGDGTYVKIAMASTRAPRRNWASPARRRDAMKTIRAMTRQKVIAEKTGRTLARLAPKKATRCAPKRKTVCRKR